MQNSIKPDVERWRSTLDTLLIFVRRFNLTDVHLFNYTTI